MAVGSKRRRTKLEIHEQKLEALSRQQAIEDKLKNLERLIEETAELKQQQDAGAKAQQTLQSMFDSGYIDVDNNGDYVPTQGLTHTQGD